MKVDSTQKQQAILNELCQGGFHSGEALGQKLGISRAAVSRQVQQLNKLGLDIYSVTGKGYALANALALLQADAIQQSRKLQSQIFLRHVTDSTNDDLKRQLDKLNNGDFCLAEAQTAGRGRQGREWVSPFGASLYLSMYWSFSGGFQAISGLSLLIGLAVTETLESLGFQGIGLKWPNDIYVQGRKLGGILVELDGQMDGQCQTIIGIGLNVKLPQSKVDIDQPWIDLAELTSTNIDRNHLVAQLADHLIASIQAFETDGLTPFIQRWEKRDCLRGQNVILYNGNQQVTGIARGIDSGGGLVLEIDGQRKVFHGGEISVRRS